MKTIFIVGFSKFGKYRTNSSEQVLSEWINYAEPGIWIVREVLPANIPTYDRGSLILEMFHKIEAQAIIILGMDSTARGITIETYARNRNDNPVYCPAECFGRAIEPGIPETEVVEVPLQKWNIDRFIADANQHGIPAQLSDDAGGFCCNHMMMQMVQAQRREPTKNGHVPWIAVHLPCTDEAVPEPEEAFYLSGKRTMTVPQMISGLRMLIHNADIK